jgi:NAD(P)-dependent dehydrogenase (short-subunit alcohol dehydrogenase family)
MGAQRLTGKYALVTAAGQGIGRATAELFAAQGADVLATDTNVEALTQLRGCRTARLDVLRADDIARVVAGAGPIDILFNCAGFVANGTILDCAEDQWALSMDLNVTSMFRLVRAVLPQMLARRSGCIINMSSVVSSIKGVPNRCAYGATKAAVIGLTKSIAADFVTSGIRCNTSDLRRPATMKAACARLSRASLWDGWVSQPKSRPWRCIWRPMKAPSLPGNATSSMADGRTDSPIRGGRYDRAAPGAALHSRGR